MSRSGDAAPFTPRRPAGSIHPLRRRFLERLGVARGRLARALEPGSGAAAGVRRATTTVTLAVGALLGLDLASGLGRPADVLLGVLLAWLLCCLGLLLFRLTAGLIEQGPRFLTTGGVAALAGLLVLLIMGGMEGRAALPVAFLVIAANAVVGASVALLVAPGGGGSRRGCAVAGLVVALVVDAALVWGLLTPGWDDHLSAWRAAPGPMLLSAVEDPGDAGPRTVRRLT